MAAADFPALTASEAEFMVQLRAKYARAEWQGAAASTGRQLDTAAPAAATEPANSSSCRMCIGCQGSGVQAECYMQRTLQRTCSECGGEGVQGGSTAPPAVLHGATARSKLAATRRLEEYEKELEGLKQSLVGCTDQTEAQLKADVILRLELHMKRLRQAVQPTQPS